MQQLHRIVASVLYLLLASCTAPQLNGTYQAIAIDQNGNDVTGEVTYIASGKSIYSLIHTICLNTPGGTVLIFDIHTGEEPRNESPHFCQ